MMRFFELLSVFAVSFIVYGAFFFLGIALILWFDFTHWEPMHSMIAVGLIVCAAGLSTLKFMDED